MNHSPTEWAQGSARSLANSKTPTPLTDAQIKRPAGPWEYVLADHARTLERELNAAKASVALRNESILTLAKAEATLRQQLAQVEKERDAAREQVPLQSKSILEHMEINAEMQDRALRAESELAELRKDRKRLRGALQFVADWNLPQVESRGELVPYAVAYGSNGERDYMRHIARAAIDSLTAAESELAELRKDRERLVSDSRLVWRSNKFLREAFIETINGLKEKLNTRYYTLFDKPQQSSAHLSWMLSELERHLDDFPADKTGRWIGYVQGCLACNDLLNVDEERDRTRPLFRKAYAIDAAMQPTGEQRMSAPSPAPQWANQAADEIYTLHVEEGLAGQCDFMAAIITKHATAISEENLALERERDKAFAYIHSLWLNGQLPAPMTDSLRARIQNWGEPKET